jgi:hypothetical protein
MKIMKGEKLVLEKKKSKEKKKGGEREREMKGREKYMKKDSKFECYLPKMYIGK